MARVIVHKKGVNVTKFDAGGSGDNYISDGYIKTVEKVWMDNYTLTANVTLTLTAIAICTLPVNKKITSIDVVIATTVSHTSGSLSVGFSTTALVDEFLGATPITHNLTHTTVSLPVGGVQFSSTTTKSGVTITGKIGGFQYVTTGTAVTIAVLLADWVATQGTIKTIVRYT